MMGFPIDASKKALIKTKNESVSAAIDVINEFIPKEEPNLD